MFDTGVILARDKTGKTNKGKNCENWSNTESMAHLIFECPAYKQLRDHHNIHQNIFNDFFKKRLNNKIFRERSDIYLEKLYKLSFAVASSPLVRWTYHVVCQFET